MRNLNPYYYCILKNSNLFQLNADVSTACSVDATVCKSVAKSHPRSNKEISTHSIRKLKDPPSFTNFVDDKSKYLARYLLVEMCPRTD